MVKDPFHFSAREVRVDDQTGIVADVIFQAVAFKLFANIGGTTALLDNSVVYRFAGFTFPDDRGFTLVGDTDSGNLIGTDIGLSQHFYQR